LLLSWALASLPLRAQTEWEGRTVVSVRQQSPDPAEELLDSATFQQLVTQQAGQPYSGQQIRESMERLYGTGRFSGISVDATETPQGVAVYFLTQGRYFVGIVRVLGADAPPTEAELQSASDLRLGYPYAEQDIPAVVERLRRVLEDDGYFQARITHRTERHPERQQVDVYFDVETGERASLGEVTITGAPALPPAEVLAAAEWEAGDDFTSERIQAGLSRVRQLYRERNYLEASAQESERHYHPDTNRADLALAIDAGAPVEIAVLGAQVSQSTLDDLLPIYQEGALDEDLLREGERNLRDYLESQGYFQVEVTHRRSTTQTGSSRLEYVVNPGPRQHLSGIEISGNRYFQTAVLRERLRMEPARWRLPYGRFSRGLLEQDAAAIRALYLSNGFSEVEVETTLEPAGSQGGIIARVAVEEGPQSVIGSFTLTGQQAFSEDALLAYVNASEGQPYSASMVATDRNNLLTLYWDSGYPSARFDWQADRAEGGFVNLRYSIDEGAPEFVRHIFVGGLEHTRVGVVNRQVRLASGEPLRQSGLLETQRRLYELGVFSRVEVGVQNPRAPETQRNVLVYAEEARRYTMKLGLGAQVGRFGRESAQGDTRFSPDVSLDITRLNVGGRPHTASLRSRVSLLQKRVALGYNAPRVNNREWLNAGIQASFDQTRDVNTFSAKRWEGSLQFEAKRSTITTWLARYAFRRVTLDSNSLQISPDEIPLQSQPVLVGMLGLTWLRDTRDLPANPRQGLFWTADFGIAAKQFGSEASFVRGLVQNSSYHPLGRSLLLARSTQFGVATPFGKARIVTVEGEEDGAAPREIAIRDIPLPERFFAGGGGSHRGFGANQAGPRDLVTGFAIGGNAVLVNSLELRFPVWRNVAGVLFHDAGNVYSSIRRLTFRTRQSNPTDFDYLSHGVGLGVRYQTPVAPVRFDVGYNLNPPRFVTVTDGAAVEQTLRRWQFLFSIGQTF
jgi:outer membrane protein assembly complex protein YaeT